MEKIYFYRKLGRADFLLSKNEKKLLPLRLKNQFFPDTLVFNWSKNLWEKTDSIPEENDEIFPAEFVEFPVQPKKPRFTGNGVLSVGGSLAIEDLSPREMAEYCDWRKENERYFLNSQNWNCMKDYFAAEICTDEEKLQFSLTFKRFLRKELEERDSLDKPFESKFPAYASEAIETPLFATERIFFDIKKGLISFSFESDSNSEKKVDSEPWQRNQKSRKVLLPFARHEAILNFLKNLESNFYPEQVLCQAYKKFSSLVKKFTGLAEISPSANYFGEENKKPPYLSEMYLLTMLPCEPKLFPVLMSIELHELKFKFKYKRTDTKILGKFLKKAHIKDHRFLRKVYAEQPRVLLLCMRLYDCGFSDINLYNRVIENKDNRVIIEYLDRRALVFFSRYSIKKRGQIATLNTLLRESEGVDYFMKDDALCMFKKYFRHIPTDLRKDILQDGFTLFNHDALSNISYIADNRKITFKYSVEQEELEDDIDGYSFRLPKTNFQMCEIGTSLHNCVASYADSVRKKNCTIVYAKKNEEYKICIELREKRICQERIDRNAEPAAEEKNVLKKWHEKHGLSA